nr:dihydrofolate reductase [uncultured bacterium]
MSKLIYFNLMSLDGFLAGENDSLDWSAPDDEVLAFINDRTRPIGTYLYGRKIYDTMKVWQTPEVIPDLSPASLEFARIWQAADKIVYSRSLETVSTPKTRLEREFDPQAVRDLKAQLPHDISVDGTNLSAQMIRAGLVDEIELLVIPYLLSGGVSVLPDGVRLKLELLDERRFGNGWVYLHYRPHV